MVNCDISFDNGQREYFAGQVLRGSIRFVLQQEMKVRRIYVCIWGRSYAKRQVGKVHYKGKEEYLNRITHLVGGSGKDEVVLKVGEYVQHFDCILPANLPSSCEGKFGHVRYLVTVVFDVPLWFDKKFEQQFTVVKPFDLNHESVLRLPNVIEGSKKFSPLCRLCCCLCCWESNPLRITVRTPGGYARGHPMTMDLEVKNESNKHIKEFEVKLIQYINYNLRTAREGVLCSRSGNFIDTITIMKYKLDGCKALEGKVYSVHNIVPISIPPTDFSSSKIIQVNYCFEINAVTSFWNSNYKFTFPITIGTVPIQSSQCSTERRLIV